jgi:diguanylate cyclase (GGDEF)-like protein
MSSAASHARVHEHRAVLDASWFLLIAVIFVALVSAWLLRLMELDLTPIAVSIFVFGLLYLGASHLLDRIQGTRLLILATTTLHAAGIVFLALLWHLSGGVEARGFLFAFVLPIVSAGMVLRDWRPYALAAVSVAAVGAVATSESSDLRWYLSTWGMPPALAAWTAPAWLPARPTPFPGLEIQPVEVIVTLGLFAAFQLSAAAFSESIATLMLRLSDRLRRADQRLETTQGLFEAVLRTDPSPSVIVSRETGQVFYASRSFQQQMLLDDDALPGHTLFDLVAFQEPQRVKEVLARGEGEISACAYRVGREGRVANLRVYGVEHEGTRYAYLGLSDLTELYYLNAVLDGMKEALLVLDDSGQLLYANELATQLFPEAHFGLNMNTLLAAHQEPDWWRASGPEEKEMKVTLRGQTYRASLIGATLAGGSSWATIVTLRSIAEEEKLYQMATHDALTQAYNRRYFEEVLPQVAAGVARGRRAALALLDMDYFKAINDQLGHAAGDEALKLFVAVVREQLRGTDVFARLGGDEFAVIFNDVGAAEAFEVMQRIYRELGVRPLVANGESRLLSFSSGVITAQAGDRPQDLMARADEALYAAKEAGRGRCEARE